MLKFDYWLTSLTTPDHLPSFRLISDAPHLLQNATTRLLPPPPHLIPPLTVDPSSREDVVPAPRGPQRLSALPQQEGSEYRSRPAHRGAERTRTEAVGETVHGAHRGSAGVSGRVHHFGGDSASKEKGAGPGAAAEGACLQEGAGEPEWRQTSGLQSR